MNESDRGSGAAVLLIPLFIMWCIIGYALFDYYMSKPPDFKYRVDDHSVVTVNPRDCGFFGFRERTTAPSLEYTENDVERTVSGLMPNLTANNGVKACVAAVTSRASKFAKIAKPLNTEVGFSSTDIHSRIEIETKDSTPYVRAYYRNGLMVNTLTFPVETCVNPQFDGPVTFAHNGKTIKNTTVNALDPQEGHFKLLTTVCNALT